MVLMLELLSSLTLLDWIDNLQELELPGAWSMWWVRFALSPAGKVLACGTPKGQVLVWNPCSLSSQPLALLRRSANAPPTPVRLLAIPALALCARS